MAQPKKIARKVRRYRSGDTPTKTDYKFYLGEHGMNKQLTDEYFKEEKV